MVNSRNIPAPPPPMPSLSTNFPPPPPSVVTKPQVTAPSYQLPPGQPSIGELVQEAFDSGYSDVHVGVGETPRFRNRGEIETTNYPETDLPTFMSWLHEVLNEDDIRTFQ
ncbi:MAG: type IV pili twitching motility protein PilT, partial [Chamaesiphon sp. CSU_1_12]|nr:type IV pili twitching motility protein PilT [Chamaesiphon sp. CSU_1_12]